MRDSTAKDSLRAADSARLGAQTASDRPSELRTRHIALCHATSVADSAPAARQFCHALEKHFSVLHSKTIGELRALVQANEILAIVVVMDRLANEAEEFLGTVEELIPENDRIVVLAGDEVLRSGILSGFDQRQCLRDVFDLNADTPQDLVAALRRMDRLQSHRRTREQPVYKLQRGLGRMIGESPKMQSVARSIRRLARSDLPILITGESGTGKEVAARAIHDLSVGKRGSFVAINCAALPASLIGSELFGYEKGAFTGATRRKLGQIEAARGGTLFLDEVGDMPTEIQIHLLRFLQEGTIIRLGGTAPIDIKTRIICATHVDLAQSVQAGLFREDLYYRLKILELEMPPLRERANDILILAEHFLHRYAEENGRRALRFSQEARQAILNYPWRGNVRELMAAVARAATMSRSGLIKARDLSIPKASRTNSPLPTLAESRARTDIRMLQDAYHASGHNAKLASQYLGISRVAFYRLLKKYGLSLPQDGRPATGQSRHLSQ